MERKTAQNYIITLNYAEYGPFLFFIMQGWLPVELDGKWKHGPESIQLSMCLPLDFDASLIPQMWEEWKNESFEDYVLQN